MCALCEGARRATLHSMHTHFASATHLAATFLGVLVAGTFWRLGWMHTMAFSVKRNMKWLRGLAGAALAQY